MTIQHAREIFEDEIQDMSDDEVAEMIEQDSDAMRAFIEVFEQYLTYEKNKCDTEHSEKELCNIHKSI